MLNNQLDNLIFLSYARSDVALVSDVYLRLIDANINVWMDTENLSPGAEWEVEVRDALRASRFVLVFLTHNSITHDGYLQKEIRIALDIWREKSPGTIYLIPVRLEDCEIHKSLQKFHWVDIFVDSGWNKLLEQINKSGFDAVLDSSSHIDGMVDQSINNSDGRYNSNIPLVTFPEEVKRFILDCIPPEDWTAIPA